MPKDALPTRRLISNFTVSEKKPPPPVEKADGVNETEDGHAFIRLRAHSGPFQDPRHFWTSWLYDSYYKLSSFLSLPALVMAQQCVHQFVCLARR